MKIQLTIKEAKVIIARHFEELLVLPDKILSDNVIIVNNDIADKLESVERRFRYDANEKIAAIKEIRKVFENISLLRAKLVVESLLSSIAYAKKNEVLPPVSEHGHYLNFK